MKIKGKDVVIYILKVYKNVTFLVAYNTESDKYAHFEISSKYNEIDKIIKLFKNHMYFFVGYGNKHYDNIFINFLIKRQDHIDRMGSSYISKKFYEELLECIKNHDWNEEMLSLKYAQNFDYIDLETMLSTKYSHYTIYERCFRDGILQNVDEESDDYIAFDDFDNEIDSISRKCELIKKIMSNNIDKIELRMGMFNEYHSDILDNNDSSALNTILLDKYQEKNNIKYTELTANGDYKYSSPVSNLISNDIKFNTDEFKSLIENIKSITYSNENPTIRRFVTYGNTNVLFATNGVECESNYNSFKSDKDQKIYMLHIESLDASVCLKYGIFPDKLTNKHENFELFRSMFNDFLANICKSPLESERHKIFTYGLDEIISKYNSKNTWLYDPSKYCRVKINSNLILMMLVEQLLVYGSTIILIEDNTIVFSSFVDMKDIISEWSDKFGIVYSCTECKKFFKHSVYDYFALDINNKVISNGMFEHNEINSFNSSIVTKAVKNKLLFNIDIEDTVKNAGNLNDFMFFHKISGNKRFMYKGIPLGKEVSFYITTQPLPTLYIEESTGANQYYKKYEPVIKGVNISVLEKYMINPTKETRFNIDYEYYITKAKSIIDEIKTVQMIIEIPNK